MPPKAAAEGDNRQTIIALCNMMLTCPEFKIDSNALAPILGVSHAKNVGRKINSLIGPYGFEYKGSKIIQKDGTTAPATPIGTSHDSTTTATTATAASKTATPKTPVSRKKSVAAPGKAPATKTKLNKKRKIESVTVDHDDDDDESEVKADTTDVIKTEDHPMSHIADDFEEPTTDDEGEDVTVKAEITTGFNED